MLTKWRPAGTDALASKARRRTTAQVQQPRRAVGRTVGGGLLAATFVGALAGSLLLVPTASADPVDTTGTVVRVVDGDTVIARIAGKNHRIRITGLNAMELTDYRPHHRKGDCHARQATRRLESLVLNKKVRITARDASSESGQRHRLRRSLAVRNAHGTWIDPAAILVQEGLALWMPNKVEYLPNSTYPVLAKQAAANRRGLWNTDACGTGPSRNAKLRITVKWQGAETVTINNQGKTPVSLTGWWLRDS